MLFLPAIIAAVVGALLVPAMARKISVVIDDPLCSVKGCLHSAREVGLCAKHAHHLLQGKSHVDVNVSEDELLFESPREWVRKAEDAEQRRWERPVTSKSGSASYISPPPSYWLGRQQSTDLQILKNDVQEIQRKLGALDQ